MQTNSSAVAAVIPISPAIKDSPAVERALSRSKLYLLVSWSLLYPEDDEFLDYVQCGEFVEDGRAAIDALDTALDGIGGELAKQKLVLLRKQFDQIEKVVASECVNWQLSDLQAEHRRVFSNVITLDCPPYETLFGNDHVFAQSQVMGDIAGFYRAFGVELSKDIHERLDHLSVEFEFMHFLAYKGILFPLSRRSRQDSDRPGCAEKVCQESYRQVGSAVLPDVGQESRVRFVPTRGGLDGGVDGFRSRIPVRRSPALLGNRFIARRRSIHRKARRMSAVRRIRAMN